MGPDQYGTQLRATEKYHDAITLLAEIEAARDRISQLEAALTELGPAGQLARLDAERGTTH